MFEDEFMKKKANRKEGGKGKQRRGEKKVRAGGKIGKFSNNVFKL